MTRDEFIKKYNRIEILELTSAGHFYDIVRDVMRGVKLIELPTKEEDGSV